MSARAYECVGGPFDGMLHTLDGGQRVSLPIAQALSRDAPSERDAAVPVDEETVDYDVRRLLAPDGRWREFLVLSVWTSMQAAVWLTRRPRQK